MSEGFMFDLQHLSAAAKEEYLHFIFCKRNLSESYQILESIEKSADHALAEPAFGYALVLYASPYTKSQTESRQRLKLSEDHIPPTFLPLHKEIVAERDRLHAHFDLELLNPTLCKVEERNGIVYSMYSSNPIFRFAKMERLPDILALIAGTMNNLEVEMRRRERVIVQRKANVEHK